MNYRSDKKRTDASTDDFLSLAILIASWRLAQMGDTGKMRIPYWLGTGIL